MGEEVTAELVPVAVGVEIDDQLLDEIPGPVFQHTRQRDVPSGRTVLVQPVLDLIGGPSGAKAYPKFFSWHDDPHFQSKLIIY